MSRPMRRREFITLLGGAAAAWPLAAGAQQDGRVRRIGLLSSSGENDPGSRGQRTAFREALAKLGWSEGRNLQTEIRFGDGDLDRIRAYAAELVRLAPDMIVTSSGAATRVVQQE